MIPSSTLGSVLSTNPGLILVHTTKFFKPLNHEMSSKFYLFIAICRATAIGKRLGLDMTKKNLEEKTQGEYHVAQQ